MTLTLDSMFDQLGNTNSYSYDYQGRLTRVQYPDGSSVTNVYDAMGQLTRVSDSGGQNRTNWYNNQGLLVAVTNAFGQVAKTIFDIEDHPTVVIDANNVAVTNAYDELDRLVAPPHADTGVERFRYSARGLIGYTNQLGTNAMKYTYDVLGRKIGETNALNEVVQFKYDAAGNLTNLVDGKSQNTHWKYDQFGRVTNKVDHLGSNMFRYAYNANDWLTNRWTPAKTNTFYAYDKAGNVTNINYDTSADIALSYDAIDRLTNMVDAVGTSRYTYTGFGAVSTEDGPWENDTVSYRYDNGRRRKRVKRAAAQCQSVVSKLHLRRSSPPEHAFLPRKNFHLQILRCRITGDEPGFTDGRGHYQQLRCGRSSQSHHAGRQQCAQQQHIYLRLGGKADDQCPRRECLDALHLRWG